jgi:hypothetical protein
MEIGIKSNILKYVLQNTYFINGTAYAGKSTMVKLLAQRHGGICCGENYHDVLMDAVDVENQPNLCYFQTMRDWQEFVNRTPREYADWIDGSSREAEGLELVRLIQLAGEGKQIFVDTNLSIETLREISDYRHVAFLLAPQSVSVERFFERGDADKQFILEQIQKAENPERTMENYRNCLMEINSPEKYRAFEQSGFFTLVREEGRTVEQTLGILENHFGLAPSLAGKEIQK